MTKEFDTDALLAMLAEKPLEKKEIAKRMGLKGADKIPLKAALKKLLADEKVVLVGRQTYAINGFTPTVLMVEIIETSEDDLVAEPVEGKHEIRVRIPATDKLAGKLHIRARALVRVADEESEGHYTATVIKAFSKPEKEHVVGVFTSAKLGGTISPVNRKDKGHYVVPPGKELDAKDGDVVLAGIAGGSSSGRRGGQTPAAVEEIVGHIDEPRVVSLIAIADHDIPFDFPAEVTGEAEKFKTPPKLGDREDLRDVPLITIDGADARDFDDAVFAEPTKDGGWHLIVAIADVSYYVREGSALDREAYKRGNSCYFPDRVVPMLPEHLSNGLCSLNPDEDRACMAVHVWLDENGVKTGHKFVRGLMRSHQRNTYEYVEENKSDYKDLYSVFKVLNQQRKDRGTLDLIVPEQKIAFNDQGQIESITTRTSLEAHKLIEEFMILANVCAAETLTEKGYSAVFRVHDLPSKEKMDDLSIFLKDMPYSLPKGAKPTPKAFMNILTKAKGQREERLINTLVLRSQSQALYDTENIGHFGLALENYAHFTSPIRRYADLLVHRALISACNLGEGGLAETDKNKIKQQLQTAAEHISVTERRAISAERDSTSRYLASYLSGQEGAKFPAIINGVTGKGMFVTLEETGADGFLPMRMLSDDYYIYDEQKHVMFGRRHGRKFRLGDEVVVELVEADGLTGGLIFKIEGMADSGGRGGSRDRNRGGNRGGGGGKPRRFDKKGGRDFSDKSGKEGRGDSRKRGGDKPDKQRSPDDKFKHKKRAEETAKTDGGEKSDTTPNFKKRNSHRKGRPDNRKPENRNSDNRKPDNEKSEKGKSGGDDTGKSHKGPNRGPHKGPNKGKPGNRNNRKEGGGGKPSHAGGKPKHKKGPRKDS